MSVMRALCCGGRGGAARGPADRGVFLRRVVVARWSGRHGSVPCRRRARVWFPGVSICLAGCSWCSARLLCPAYEGAERLGAFPVENRNCCCGRPTLGICGPEVFAGEAPQARL